MPTSRSSAARKLSAEEIVVNRRIDAPRERVFAAFTDPEELVRWWGPKGFTTPSCKVDLRKGGTFHYCMRSPEGKEYWGKGVFRDIVWNERIVYTDSFSDEKGDAVSPAAYGLSADWPQESLVTVELGLLGTETNLTLRHEVPSAPPSELDLCRQGWEEMIDRLAEYLEGARS
jgi:uncharacterized protein YndB with AHSA1/START domain